MSARLPSSANGRDRSLSHLIDRKGWCRLVYEPIADLARGVICGFEAVARFPAAMRPDPWRAEAVRRGLEPDLEAYVIRSVLNARESLPEDCFLTFDVRPETLLREPVRTALADAGRLEGLVVELRPRPPDGDEERLAEAIAALRREGAAIAVDGVGAGFASLHHLTVLRPEFVKVDAALVRGVHRDDAKLALLEMIGQLTSRLDASVVALGVAEVGELDALLRLRVPLAQGPLVGVRAKTLTPIAFPLAPYVRDRRRVRSCGGGLSGPGR